PGVQNSPRDDRARQPGSGGGDECAWTTLVSHCRLLGVVQFHAQHDGTLLRNNTSSEALCRTRWSCACGLRRQVRHPGGLPLLPVLSDRGFQLRFSMRDALAKDGLDTVTAEDGTISQGILPDRAAKWPTGFAATFALSFAAVLSATIAVND